MPFITIEIGGVFFQIWDNHLLLSLLLLDAEEDQVKSVSQQSHGYCFLRLRWYNTYR